MTRDQKDTLATMLAELSNADLAEILLTELDRRRLDSEGTPKELPGLYMAAVTALLALLEQRTSVTIRISKRGTVVDDWEKHWDAKLVERLAKVALGARLANKNQEVVEKIREIAVLVESLKRSRRYPTTELRAQALATTLPMILGHGVDVTSVSVRSLEHVFSVDTVNGRVTEVACLVAASLFGKAWVRREKPPGKPPTEKVFRRKVLGRVRGALADDD